MQSHSIGSTTERVTEFCTKVEGFCKEIDNLVKGKEPASDEVTHLAKRINQFVDEQNDLLGAGIPTRNPLVGASLNRLAESMKLLGPNALEMSNQFQSLANTITLPADLWRKIFRYIPPNQRRALFIEHQAQVFRDGNQDTARPFALGLRNLEEARYFVKQCKGCIRHLDLRGIEMNDQRSEPDIPAISVPLKDIINLCPLINSLTVNLPRHLQLVAQCLTIANLPANRLEHLYLGGWSDAPEAAKEEVRRALGKFPGLIIADAALRNLTWVQSGEEAKIFLEGKPIGTMAAWKKGGQYFAIERVPGRKPNLDTDTITVDNEENMWRLMETSNRITVLQRRAMFAPDRKTAYRMLENKPLALWVLWPSASEPGAYGFIMRMPAANGESVTSPPLVIKRGADLYTGIQQCFRELRHIARSQIRKGAPSKL